LPATTKAVEATDHGVGELLKALESVNGRAVICADHGNAEQMWDPTVNGPHTAHTTNPVPIVIGRPGPPLRRGGALKDVAPTVLALQGLTPPPEMTGRDLRELQNGGPASGQPS